jgi:hypothetical protein
LAALSVLIRYTFSTECPTSLSLLDARRAPCHKQGLPPHTEAVSMCSVLACIASVGPAMCGCDAAWPGQGPSQAGWRGHVTPAVDALWREPLCSECAWGSAWSQHGRAALCTGLAEVCGWLACCMCVLCIHTPAGADLLNGLPSSLLGALCCCDMLCCACQLHGRLRNAATIWGGVRCCTLYTPADDMHSMILVCGIRWCAGDGSRPCCQQPLYVVF